MASCWMGLSPLKKMDAADAISAADSFDELPEWVRRLILRAEGEIEHATRVGRDEEEGE